MVTLAGEVGGPGCKLALFPGVSRTGPCGSSDVGSVTAGQMECHKVSDQPQWLQSFLVPE